MVTTQDSAVAYTHESMPFAVKSTDSMSQLLLLVGGVVVLAETFSHDIYRKSLARLFELDENGYLQMYFGATLDVTMSKVRAPVVSAARQHGLAVCNVQNIMNIPCLLSMH